VHGPDPEDNRKTTEPDMLPGDNTGQVDHYALPDRLHVGLYIHIDLPWFRHPFTRNSFKISSEEQIRALRALKMPRFRYDPERSDDVPGGASAAPLGAAAPAAETPTQSSSGPGPAMAAIHPRVRQLREHQKAVARTEKSFVKAVGIMRRLNRILLSQPRETLEEMGGLVDQMVTVFLDRPEVTLQVMGENCGGDEAYHHSLNVSILCMMLVKGLKLGSEQAGVLGTGALLHDIGLTEIPDRILKIGCNEQTKAERELRARHVEFGVRMGTRLELAPDTLSIIEQHHELADGSGYPRGLRLEQIAPLARVVSLANFYDNLCNPADFAQAMTPHEALSFIFARRRDQFDAQVLQLMIRSLGVYPPGSIVKLSNEAIGMVVSVNPHTTLRPWVLLYDAAVPKEQAAMLNLETETDVGISKAIRPARLPAPVYAYLSPRKRITYFFDGGPPNAGGRE
jgi:putative nucleotidyltransferase with HDIG domain